MSDDEQDIQGMVRLPITQRPGADTGGVAGSTSTRREPINSLQHDPLSMVSLFFTAPYHSSHFSRAPSLPREESG